MKFIVATSWNALTIDAFVKVVVSTRSSIDDFVCEFKIVWTIFQPAKKFALVFSIQSILWQPLRVVPVCVEFFFVEAAALLGSEVKTVVKALLDVTRPVLDLVADAAFSTIGRRWIVANPQTLLNSASTVSGAIAEPISGS